MAHFEGTVAEFTKFIGGYSRNKVQYMTRNYRRNIGKCEGEGCGSRTKKLDAAHIRGKERPIIIQNILENFYDGENIKIDLNVFEVMFKEAHDPIEKTIKILCKDCHRAYDSKAPISDFISEDEDDIDLEERDLNESEAITNLVLNSKMTKKRALEILNINGNLNTKNTVYSSRNAAVDVWWLEPSNEKFRQDLFIILNDSVSNKLVLFKIPNNTIDNPELLFDQRSDRDASKIIIPTSNNNFVDKKGFNFKSFLITEIVY